MEMKDAMLIYKAWLETRWRFAAGLALLVAIVFFAVFHAPTVIEVREQFRGEHILYAQYLWVLLYKGYFQIFWISAAVALSLGGLWREQPSGAASFTLSLPVSRRRLVLVRSAVGAAEAVVLALVPCVLIWAISPLAGYSYPLSQALSHAALIAGGGLIFYGWGLLLSHLMQGEFSTPTVALSVCLGLFFSFKELQLLEDYSPFDLMSGKHCLDPNTFLLHEPLPWLQLICSLAVAAAIAIASAIIAEVRDF